MFHESQISEGIFVEEFTNFTDNRSGDFICIRLSLKLIATKCRKRTC